MRSLWGLLIGFAAATAQATPPKLAVLELNDRANLQPAQVRYLTGRVRSAAVRAGYFVLSRENILQQLPPGTDLAACEGECEVETGRNVGADQVASGDIVRLGSELRVALRLHETRGGRLLNSTRAAGTIEALDGPLAQAATRLFSERREDDRVIVRFTTTPPRAAVHVDGERICPAGHADCRIRMKPGTHAVSMFAPGHAPLHRTERFTATTELHWTLTPDRPTRAASKVSGAWLRRLGWRGIASGIFEMGDAQRGGSATPVRSVRVGRFRLMRAEVTVGQYQRCVRAGGCTAPRRSSPRCTVRVGRSDLPINCVSARQAADFCRWVGGRLPSEAEWEYAARDRRNQSYPWGRWRHPDCDRVVMRDGRGSGCGRKAPWPICSKAEGNTESGLCDMQGNLAEFTADCWHRDYHGAPGGGLPWTDACHADAVVVRGGSFADDRRTLHVAERRRDMHGSPAVDVGFRCAR